MSLAFKMMTVDKQEGVYAGGKAEYTGVRTFEVYSDYSKGCMDDIRFGKSNAWVCFSGSKKYDFFPGWRGSTCRSRRP